jgi:hypothetical protein
MTLAEAIEKFHKEIANSPASPVGHSGIRFISTDVLSPRQNNLVVLNAANQSHVFRLQIEPPHQVAFYHWSPGTGSRWAVVPLDGMAGLDDAWIAISWSPKEMQLAVIPANQPPDSHRVAIGTPSKRQFRLTQAQTIIQLGDHGVDIMDPWIFHGETLFVGPTAIETWRSVVMAVEILLTGVSDKGYLFEVTRANSVLVALATGFETYCSKRFIEIEQEGSKPDLVKLATKFGWSRRGESIELALQQIGEAARTRSVSVIEQIINIEKRINFQNFDNANSAYAKTYGIKFGEIGITGNEIDRLRTLLRYRHRIVHVSPMLALLNQPPPAVDKMEHACDALAKEAIDVFSKFIELLHDKTLALGVPAVKANA